MNNRERRQERKNEKNQKWLAAQGNRTVPGKHYVPVLTQLDLVFGNIAHLPAQADIPKEFWDDSHPAAHAASQLFFKGGKLSDFGFTPREGIPPGSASIAIGAILASFEPQHQHKIAGAAMLIDQWFERKEA